MNQYYYGKIQRISSVFQCKDVPGGFAPATGASPICDRAVAGINRGEISERVMQKASQTPPTSGGGRAGVRGAIMYSEKDFLQSKKNQNTG